jgi:hypothetical protein
MHSRCTRLLKVFAVPSVQHRKANQSNGHAMGTTYARGSIVFFLVDRMCASCEGLSFPSRRNVDVSPRGISRRSPESLALVLWCLPIQAPRELHPAARGRDCIALPRWIHRDMRYSTRSRRCQERGSQDNASRSGFVGGISPPDCRRHGAAPPERAAL